MFPFDDVIISGGWRMAYVTVDFTVGEADMDMVGMAGWRGRGFG